MSERPARGSRWARRSAAWLPSARCARRLGAWLVGALAIAAAPADAQSRLFATRPGDGDVVTIDLASGAVAATLPAGSLPTGAVLSADGSRLYVADATAGELRVFDTAGAAVGSVAVGAGPAGVALCTGGARVAVALAGGDAVAVVDTATLGVVATLPTGDQPLAVACADGFLAAASYGSASVSVFDATTLVGLGTAAVGSFPAGVTIAAGRAWVTSMFDSTVTVVTLVTANVVTTVAVGSAPRGIAAAGGRVFVTDVNDGALTVLDALSASVVGTVALPSAAPTDLLVDPTTGNLLVAHLGEPAISIVDPASLTVTGTVSAPVGLLALAGVAVEGGVAPTEVPALGPFGLVVLAATLALLGVRWRRGLAAALLLVAIAHGAPARAQTATFTESTFNNADWEVFSASGSHSEGQTALDGNPAPSRRMTHFQEPSSTVRVFHRWVTAVYDPAASGAVASLAVSRDRRTCGGDGPLDEVRESFVVYQGGVAYAALESAFSSPTWEAATQSGLTAQDFDDGLGGSPDFSTLGAPISFGYLRATTSGAGPFAVTCHAIDNLTVTVQAETPTGTSSVGFTQRDYFPLDGEDLQVRVTRGGDLTVPASVDVLLSVPLSSGVLRTVTWAAGAGGEATTTFAAGELGGAGLAVRTLQLQNPSTGVAIEPGRDRAMVYRGSDELGGLWAIIAALLARWDLAGLLLLALAAAYGAVRRRRQQRPGDGAGDGAVEVGVERRASPERGGGGPPSRALGGELDGERGEQRGAGAAVAAQGGHAAGREQAVQDGGEAGHGRGARRKQEHAERGAQPAGERRGPPLPRVELAADGERDQRQARQVPRQVRGAQVHDVRCQEPPQLAAQHGGAQVAERCEAAGTRGSGQDAGAREHEEGSVSTQGASASWHTRGGRRAARGSRRGAAARDAAVAPPPRVALRVVLWLLLAAPALLVSWGCVGTGEINLKFKEARFNERIAADLQGLSPTELDTDLRYGIFRDGSADPDGVGPRRKGLVSEIFPLPAASSAGPGNLVQTPCLFSGRRGPTSDELRLSWEVVETIDREADDYLNRALREDHAEVGLCTFSSPAGRLLFEDPGVDPQSPSPEAWADKVMSCGGGVPTQTTGSGFAFSFTLAEDPTKNPHNQPMPCRFGDLLWTRLESFAPVGDNPDAACPLEAFPAGPTRAAVYGCPMQDDLLPSCALPCALQPAADASYRVSVDPVTGQPPAERWLQPNVLVVKDQRLMARRMEAPQGSLAFAWQTKVTRPGGGMEGPVRWAENFTPTVQVDTVQIVSRNSTGGGEQVETPTSDRLLVEVPRAGATTATTLLQCTGRVKPQGFTFTLADCRTPTDPPAILGPLTPTYLVENLHLDPVVETPVTWRVTLNQLGTGRQVFIKFGLRAQTMGSGLRVSGAYNFGRQPDNEYRQGAVELENVGGENVTITAVDLVPGTGQPQDFSFFVVGDPVPMPLPFEAKTQADGTMTWWLGDLRDVPLVDLQAAGGGVTVTIGDGAAAPGQPQPVTLYGEGARLRGGVLIRDHAGAVFTPPASSYPRPLTLPAFAQQTLPFVLRPGERRQVVVEARPSALGVRLATLRVRGVPASNPTQTLEVRSQLQVEVVSGPLLSYLPYSLYVYRDANGSQPGHRTALIENPGHADLTVSSVRLTGAGAAHFAITTDHGNLGPFVLHSGESALVRLEYLPECDGTYGTATSALDHQATIAVTSTGGNAAIPVGGASQGFCP